ncbi:MAG: indolepyruvate ferredoxin oxidoreductase subunit alpha [Syntrophomonadaceae bacterium]
MQRRLLLGNEAIAWGAISAGVKVVTAYPGTPSTEVFTTLAENASRYGYHAEWCVNEKVAMEIAYGAAISGARALVAMKQVGLNVAADPLLSGTYLGVKAGLVIVVADDPGPHSSQTEQDTRQFARFAKVPVLDPSDPQEALEMAREAFNISEKYRLPVILRPTTRVCHAGQDVLQPEINQPSRGSGFAKDGEWVIFPNVSYRKHGELLKTLENVSRDSCSSPFNRIEGHGQMGIVCSGVSYNYVIEALKRLKLDTGVLKIGTPYPFPEQLALDFIRNKKSILVVEEQDPVIEDELLRLTGDNGLILTVSGKRTDTVAAAGELNVDLVEQSINKWEGKIEEKTASLRLPELPVRKPILCAGCPHRASFYAIRKAAGKKSNTVFTGDIGCYTLGTMPPLSAVDTCLCMGASITQAQGIGRAEPGRKTIAVLGDSTFYHTGIPGLINAVYNQYPLTLVILDNSTTAMTGFQPHPGIGRTAMGEEVPAVDMVKLIEGCGVKQIKTVDPVQLKSAIQAVKEALDFNGPAVVIMKRACINLPGTKTAPVNINNDLCRECGLCITEIGCPALVMEKGEKPQVLDDCTGCRLCMEVCPFEAIEGGNC